MINCFKFKLDIQLDTYCYEYNTGNEGKKVGEEF